MEAQRRIKIILSTYNRPEMFCNLLTQLSEQQSNCNIDITVMIDGSKGYSFTDNYSFDSFNVVRIPHCGKERYWQLINTGLYLWSVPQYPDFILFMPDDITVKPDFISELLRLWDSINDQKKIALSYLTLERYKGSHGNWTAQESVQFGEVWRTQWLDMAFIAPANLFMEQIPCINPIDPERWKGNPGLSSGVGQQISKRLFAQKFNMYHSDKSLCYHGAHDSQMHPIHRKQIPLITDTQ